MRGALVLNSERSYLTAFPFSRIVIFPKAEGGQGVLRIYGPDGQLELSVILSSFDHAVFEDDRVVSLDLVSDLEEPHE